MKRKQENINWFGETPKKKIRYKKNSNEINYLGLSTSASKQVNFLSLKNKSHKMSPSLLFKKESIKKKRLSKWGDADLDGTPNYFDCDARKAFKDYKVNDEGNRVSLKSEREILKETKQKMNEIKEEKKKAKREKVKKIFKPIKKLYRAHKKRSGYGGLIEETQEDIGQSISILGRERKEKMEELKEKKEKGYSQEELKEVDEEIKMKTKQEEQLIKGGKSIEEQKTKADALKDIMKKPGLAGTMGYARRVVEEKIAAGEKPTKKELSSLAKLERKAKKIGDIQQEGKISREILTKIPGGEIGRVITGAGVDKSGEYSKALKAKSARVSRMTKYAAGQLFGPSLTQTHFDSEPRGRGRPPGPSGEYKIGGKPVYEEEFQQYASKQSALNRMLPSQQQSATLNPEYTALIKAQKAEERGETQTVFTEEGMPMEGEVSSEQDGYPTTGTSMMQTGQQQINIRDKRAYNRATPDEIKEAQAQAQKMDNPLMAPNFMRGELKATGGSLLTPIGPSILEAPKVFQGEMRNVVQSNPEEGEIKLSERPQTNPYGDEYLEIELGSGRPVLKKRIKEKWMTGEAL